MAAEGEHGGDEHRHEVALTGAGGAPASLREHLPGVESERQVSDWGRSEIVEGALDRTVYDFLFHYWFRVEVDGITSVPAAGPALLIANHAGALPADAAMIAKAIRERRPGAGPVHFATERRLGSVPGLDMLIVKAGGVTAHPANLHRLLFDEGQLVLTFPEAGGGGLRSRYRLTAFTRLDALRVALAAAVPIVPIAVLGAAEASPRLGRVPLGPLARLPIGAAVPLPAKLRVRFLDALVAPPGTDPEQLAGDLRALIQENLLEMLGQRRSVWLG